MIRVSEVFGPTISGEAPYTGVVSVWVRLFGCNLRCPGFFNVDPANPDTYEPGYKTIDASSIKKLEDLPVVTTGCDSFYSWDPKFRHLGTTYQNAEELFKDIHPMLYDGNWEHPITKNIIDLCITGGEPMLQQDNVIEILTQYLIGTETLGYAPRVQIETNGTIPLTQEFQDFVNNNINNIVIHFNISPKLYHVSGEKDAVKYDTIIQYNSFASGILKFVINNDDRAWDELNNHVDTLVNKLYCSFPVYIMPVGATYEQQTDCSYVSQVANKALKNGYHISGRLHAVLFGNQVGT